MTHRFREQARSHGDCIKPPVTSTTFRPGLAPVTRFLAFPEEHFVAHHRLVRVFALHVFDVGVVVRHAHHQARGLTEVFTEATQVIEHLAPSSLTLAAAPGMGLLYPYAPWSPRPQCRP